MKKQLLTLLLVVLGLAACKDNDVHSGLSILPDEDLIVVGVDSFGVKSALQTVDYIYSAPDSFLLGECDSRFGTLHADILAQFTCPIDYRYPDAAEVDSVCVFLYYTSWYGSGNSPMSISIHEMDKQTFSYTEHYPSNLNVEDYCSLDESTLIIAQPRIITAASPTDSIYSSTTETYIPYIRFRTTDEFAESFFARNDYSSQNTFNQNFKGLYISSEFGNSTLLHIGQVTMAVYFHYTYQKNGQDTTVSDMKSFYSNAEVRQVNHLQYTNLPLNDLQQLSDSVNFIVSPANIYTELAIPIQLMSDTIIAKLGDKRPYVNRAKLTVDVLNVYTGSTADKTSNDWAQPAAYMMLLKESASERFFRERELPSDTCAILGSLTAGTDDDGNTIYYYEYDISTLLTQQLRDQIDVDSLRMLLVPVHVTTSTSSSTTVVSAVEPQSTISATVVRSANNKDNPMRFEVVYSGF